MNKLLLLPVIAVTLVACERTDRVPASTDNTRKATQKEISRDGAMNTPVVNPNKDADNTDRNVRDRDMKTLTPGDQLENQNDITLTQKIRQAIIADGALSTNAKNIKIITINGVVTLRGPVASTAEKDNIEQKATSVQGVKRIVSEIEVTRNN